MTYFAALTGLLVGSAYGYVAQRGAFCMNSGFRAAVTERNTTKVKAYALAIAVQMLGVPLRRLMSWDVLFVLGIPVGAFVAARKSGPVTASKVSSASASKHFAGSAITSLWT
jgi:hypothetical protein